MKKEERESLLKIKLEEMKTYERPLYLDGLHYIAGVDEVGRGPLAGPVVAAAVVLPEDFDILGIDDSKKLSEKKRQQLYVDIVDNAIAYGIGQVDNQVIDQINILEATKVAMTMAIDEANRMLMEKNGSQIQHILFDAITIKTIKTPQTSIIKGDAKSVSIAAASILAKVTRDTYMVELHKDYPFYSFDSNKGYGTKLHYEGIKEHGITPLHRKTFLRNLDEK
ncbi:MAG: ribonuclease HII [Anaerovoracaceae bacterium]